MERLILHCDMNNYYASVEEKYNPSLRKVPFAVCGDPEMRHSIVMSKNAAAKKAGVITGLSFFQARKLCPNLGYVKADYQKYLRETKLAREIYMKYTDTVIPYGMDEAWIDLTGCAASMGEAAQIADVIRIEIKYSLELSASVGVSDNLIFAKLGSDYKKPDATTVVTRDNYRQVIWPLPASDLLFVGKERRHRLSSIGIDTIGDIANSKPAALIDLLGKVGHDLWQFSHGNDRGFTPDNGKIGSVGNTITPPEDLHTNDEASAIMYLLANSVCARLKRHRLKANCVSVCMKDGRFNTTIRQRKLSHPSDGVAFIFNQAYDLFTRHYPWDYPLRSLGLRVDGLDAFEQLSLIDDDCCEVCVDIDGRVRKLTDRFGELKVEKAVTTKDW